MKTDQKLPLDLNAPNARMALEAITRILSWTNEPATLKQRGLRVDVILYCYWPYLINGATLEELGTRAGCTKQAVHKVVVSFRKALTKMAQTPCPDFLTAPTNA